MQRPPRPRRRRGPRHTHVRMPTMTVPDANAPARPSLSPASPSLRKRWWRRRWRWTLVAAILGYAALMTFGGCADRLLLLSSTRKIDAGPAKQQFIENHGRRLEIWTARAQGQDARVPQAFVLEFCGNATRAEQIARFVADRWKDHAAEAWVVN